MAPSFHQGPAEVCQARLRTGRNGASGDVQLEGASRDPADRFFNNGQAILIFIRSRTSRAATISTSPAGIEQVPRREDILRMDYQINEKTRLSGRFIRNEDEQRFAYGTTSARGTGRFRSPRGATGRATPRVHADQHLQPDAGQ